MFALLRFVFVAAILAFGLQAESGPPAHAAQTQAVSGQYIVVLDRSADAQSQANNAEQNQGVSVDHVYSNAVNGYSFRGSAAAAAEIARDPQVRYVVPDRVVRAVGNVPLAAGETVPTGVRRIGAATATTARQASSVSVAVIDTGVDLSHPDLNAVSGKNCIGTGPAQDDNGHGTHVSGTIGAKNNGAGVVGVAPGTKIYAVKVLDATGSGTWSSVICGIDWVTANTATLNIKVASMSLGGSGSNDNNCGNTNLDPLHTAICRSSSAGVTYVVAAGNDALDFAGFTPAAYPEVLTVTAMADSDGLPGGLGGSPSCWPGQPDDAYASFSNFATAPSEVNHTIAGPGVCTYSTWLNGGYNTISGTSMATPHVSGAVALCFGEASASGPCTGLTPAQAVQKLRADAAAHATAANGFVGDPFSPVTLFGDNDVVYTPYFGYLAWAGSSAPVPADFTLSVSPASQSVVQGASTSYTVSITRSGGFSGAVSLSASGLPAGATAAFSPTSTTGSSSILTVTTSASTPAGSSLLTITGTSTSTSPALNRTWTATLVVTAAPVPNFTLSVSPASQSVVQGASTSYTVSITRSGGFSGAVSLSASGLPAGATATFAPASTTGASSSLTVTTSASTPAGSSLLTITGTSTSPALNRTWTATLVVTAAPVPNFTLSVSPASQSVVQGASTSYSVSITRSGGFSGAVSLSVTGLPAGATAAFSPTSTTGSSSILTVTTSASTPAGSSLLTITGTSTSPALNRAATATLVVTAAPTPDFNLSVSPASQSVVQGASTGYTVSITRSGGFSGAVSLSVTGLPAGATAAFSPNPAGGSSATLTIATATTTPTGSFAFTITGASGSLSRTASATLVVTALPLCVNGDGEC